MRISTIGYSMKQGVKNIRRNKMFSIASIATMAACIFLFGLFYSIVVNFNYIVEKAEEGVAITVFFNEDTTHEQKDSIGAQLKKENGVLKVNYVQMRHGTSSKISILESPVIWRKDLRVITRLQILTTMKYIFRTYQSRRVLYLLQNHWREYVKLINQMW